jgi:hypothetical protein
MASIASGSRFRGFIQVTEGADISTNIRFNEKHHMEISTFDQKIMA